jgi:molybdate transport system substrate-binding protein
MRRLLPFLLFLTTALHAAEVRVFAAASLREAVTEIAAKYERGGGERVTFSFGASSMLARQIQEGAPADLFLSADEAKVNALAKRGLVHSRASVLSNTLVIVVPAAGGKNITAPQQLVNAESIALGEPSSVPAGIYAREWLQKLGLWERIAQKVIPMDNVRAALAAVESGNASAAIVYRTDAMISKKVRVAYEVPHANGPAISYPFAVLKEADNRRGAEKLLAFLRSPEALAVFAKHGFIVRK